ncbi:MAG: hypothetical protein AAF974_09995 [Cyanobacteria bacterium P01_E01_bin.34]
MNIAALNLGKRQFGTARDRHLTGLSLAYAFSQDWPDSPVNLLDRVKVIPTQVGVTALTVGAVVVTLLAVAQVGRDFSELRRVNAIMQQLDSALNGDDITPAGNALREAEELREQLRSPAAEQALNVRLEEEGKELAFELQSAVSMDLARQFIEDREYARARNLGQTVRWLVDYLASALDEEDAAQLQKESNLQFFDDIEGWIALRRFRASADNFTSKREAVRIQRDYPSIYAEFIEVFQERALLKYNNGLRLLESGDLQGAAQSFEVAVEIIPSQPDYRARLEEVRTLLDAP